MLFVISLTCSSLCLSTVSKAREKSIPRMCSSETLSCAMLDNTCTFGKDDVGHRTALLESTLGGWEVSVHGPPTAAHIIIRSRTTKQNTLCIELSRTTTGHRLLSFPFSLPGFCSLPRAPCLMVLITSSRLSLKMALSILAIFSAKASPPYFSNSLGIMSVQQARWFFRVFNARSTSSEVMELKVKVPRSCALGDLNWPSKYPFTRETFLAVRATCDSANNKLSHNFTSRIRSTCTNGHVLLVLTLHFHASTLSCAMNWKE